MPLTTLLVDDEPLAREGLRMLLSQDPEITSIHEARNGREAVCRHPEMRPDLVFLDVQMPEMDGFSVVKEVGAENMPAVVFVTAHDQYAIAAFEINAHGLPAETGNRGRALRRHWFGQKRACGRARGTKPTARFFPCWKPSPRRAAF